MIDVANLHKLHRTEALKIQQNILTNVLYLRTILANVLYLMSFTNTAEPFWQNVLCLMNFTNTAESLNILANVYKYSRTILAKRVMSYELYKYSRIIKHFGKRAPFWQIISFRSINKTC